MDPTGDPNLPPANPDAKTNIKNPGKEAIEATTERKELATAILKNFERRQAEAADSLSPEDLSNFKILEQLLKNEDIGKIVDADLDRVAKFVDCEMGIK
jgi:hypothetical protein